MARRAKPSTVRKGRRPNDRIRSRKTSRHLDGVKEIDLTDTDFLRKFMTDYGKIVPARLTGATAKQQRQIKAGIRRARNIGLLP